MQREPFESDVTADQIDRYLAGECTPAEAAHVRAYLACHPHLARYHHALRAALYPEFDRTGLDLEQTFAALDTQTVIPTPSRSRTGALSRMVGRYARIATAMGLLGVVSVTLWTMMRHHTARSAAFAGMVYHTSRGERATIQLADGSRVTLGAESQLRFHQPFSERDRNVEVEGEAYFSVVPNASYPFVVYTRHAITRVLGTSFEVRAYPEDTVTRVIVASGKVLMQSRHGAPRAEAAGVTLTMGDLSQIGARGSATVVRNVDVDTYLSWVRGRLAFTLAPLREVTRQLDRWYGVQVVLADSAMGDRTVTVSFSDESPDEAIALLCDALDLRSVRHGRQVTLFPRSH